MREPMVVDRAVMAPNACKCGNTQGPLLDTFFEDRVGRVYVCKRCARMYARAFGFAPGKRMDELNEASALVEVKDAEIARLVATIEEVRIEAGAERRTVKELRERLEYANGVMQSTRHLATSIEQSAHELVEAVAPHQPTAEAVAA